jgi:hypothetical protein
MAVVCAYQIQSAPFVTADEPRWAWCVLHSGERCWVTHESLVHHRADLAEASRVGMHASDGSPPPPRSGVAMTVVDVAHPYPVQWEPMFQRLGHIEAMLRRRCLDPPVGRTASPTSDRPCVLAADSDDRDVATTHCDLDAFLHELLEGGSDDGLDLSDLCG